MGIFGKFLKKENKTKEPQQPEHPTTISYDDLLRSVLQRHDLRTDHKGALAEFEAACSGQPDTAEKFYWLGCLHYTIAGARKDVAHVDKAITTFEKALKLKPDYPLPYKQLIGAYISKRDRGKVISTAKRWLEVDPNNETAKNILSQYS